MQPEKREVTVSLKKGGEIGGFTIKSSEGAESLGSAAALKIVELEIPLEKLRFPEEYTTIEFVVTVLKNNQETERWPYQSSVTMPKPSEDFTLRTWSAL
jgi:hypothetical protein